MNFSLHKHQAYIRPLFDLYSALKHLDSNELANKSPVNFSLEPFWISFYVKGGAWFQLYLENEVDLSLIIA